MIHLLMQLPQVENTIGAEVAEIDHIIRNGRPVQCKNVGYFLKTRIASYRR